MAGRHDLERLDCVCGALLLRANARGIEVYCPRCKRRVLVPFSDLRGKEQLRRFLDEWRTQAKGS